MPKFAYVGDEPSVVAFGLTFPKGEAVEVTNQHALRKLAHHPHFRSVVDAPPPMALPAEAPEIGATLADMVAEPHDVSDAGQVKQRKRVKKEAV